MRTSPAILVSKFCNLAILLRRKKKNRIVRWPCCACARVCVWNFKYWRPLPIFINIRINVMSPGFIPISKILISCNQYPWWQLTHRQTPFTPITTSRKQWTYRPTDPAKKICRWEILATVYPLQVYTEWAKISCEHVWKWEGPTQDSSEVRRYVCHTLVAFTCNALCNY